ncbi:hypothetical protein N8987_03670 [Crocinitomix sp.]|nr:hypothetical protein [Crocinitomix sp.]
MGKRIGKFGLVNYVEHPTNKQYRVFSFDTKFEADLFEKGLTENKVWFERDEEDHKESTLHLFAIKEREFEKAQRVNFSVSADTRNKIIPNVFLRYLLILTVLGVIILALIGYSRS